MKVYKSILNSIKNYLKIILKIILSYKIWINPSNKDLSKA